MEGEYEVRLHCHNCGVVEDYMIPKGTRVVTVACDNCGVKQLKRLDYFTAKSIEDKVKDELREEMGLDDD